MPYLILTYVSGVLVTAGLAAASGFIAKVFYLAGCVALSVWSSRKNPWDYLLLTLWIAALTPFARRLVDVQAGWDATNVMLMAPFLVAAPMIPAILKRLRTLDAGAALFPGIAALCIFYGLVLTLLRGQAAPGLIGVADWGVPLLYYFFVVTHRDGISELLKQLPQFVTTNMLLLGVYGVWQYATLPEWDRYWMKSAEVAAFGDPEPFLVRVFSTMNSAGPFSCWIMVLIILSFGFTSRLMPIARLAGALALAFTSVRTSWGGLALALLILMMSSGRKVIRYVLGLAVAGLVVTSVVASVPAIDKAISQRIATFENLQEDGSLLEREEEASRMQTLIAENPLGVGIGTLGRGEIAESGGQILFTGPIDDGILEIFGSLGWLFGLVFCAALAGVAVQCARPGQMFVQQQRVAFAAGVACVAALPLTNIVTGVTGTIMWMMLGLATALSVAQEKVTQQNQSNRSARQLNPSPQL
jgi:hypothetical protein